MYYNRYKIKPLDGEWHFDPYWRKLTHFTRKSWNYQYQGCCSSERKSKKWLKKICNKRCRKIDIYNGNQYRRANEYWWTLS